MKAAKDCLELVLHAHIVAAAESPCDTFGGNHIELSEVLSISLCRQFCRTTQS